MRYGVQNFLSDSPPPRVMGSEMEYWVEVPLDDVTPMYEAGAEALGYDTQAQMHGFIPNGGKLQPDCKHLEYSTPECITAEELALAGHAGRAIVTRLVEKSGKSHNGIHDRAVSVDYGDTPNADATRGYHENYCIPKDEEVLQRIEQYMPTFLATRTIWSGSGYMSRRGFRISQKASGLGRAYTTSTGDRTADGKKPMILITGDGGTEELIRCEIRAMDPTRSWQMQKLGFSATSLCLRLMETGDPGLLESLPRLTSAVSTIKSVSQDISMQGTYPLHDGTHRSAADIQFQYARAAYKHSRMVNLPPEEQAAARQWYWLCAELVAATRSQSDLIGQLRGRFDWAARAAAIRQHLGPRALKSFSYRAAYLDTAWDRIDAFQFGKRGKIAQDIGRKMFAHAITPEQLAHARLLEEEPPANTRAARRARVFRSDKKPMAMDWGYVKYSDHNTDKVKFEPYEHREPIPAGPSMPLPKHTEKIPAAA